MMTMTTTMVLANCAEENGYRMIQVQHDCYGYHVYYFEFGECLCSDSFSTKKEAMVFMEEIVSNW